MMQTRPRAVAFLSLMTLLTPSVTATASATTITFGNTASGEANLFPFSSEYSALFATRYQQVYNEALFSGLSDISAVTFYGVSGPGFAPGTNASGTYTLSLSTTSKPVGGLDTSMANNLGVDGQTFFSGALPPYPPVGPLTFPLLTPFLFNPTAGNLLLDVQFSGVTNGSVAWYVAQDGDFEGASSRMVNGMASGTVGYGLVTSFTVGPAVAPVPESEGTLTFFFVGLGALLLVARTQKDRPSN